MASICARPGCPLPANASGFCAQDTPKYNRDPEQNAFYKSAFWKRLSAQVRREEPVCRECGVLPSSQTDHIDGNWRNNDRANLRGICFQCHKLKHPNNFRGGNSRHESSPGGDTEKNPKRVARAYGPIGNFSGYASGGVLPPNGVQAAGQNSVPGGAPKNPYEDAGF